MIAGARSHDASRINCVRRAWAGVEVAAAATLLRHEATIDRHTRQSSSHIGRP